MSRREYRQGDFFAVPMGTGSHGIGLVTGVFEDGVVAVYLFARQWAEPPLPGALAVTEVVAGEAIWGMRVEDGALRRRKWPLIGPVPELRLDERALPTVEPSVARPEELEERLTRLFATPAPAAHLFTRGKWFILVELARAESGFRVEIEPGRRLPHSISDEALGAAVRMLLERAVVTVPDPSWDDAPLPPCVKAAGVKTVGAFNRTAHLLTITRLGDRVQLVPMRKLSHRASEPISEEKRMVDLAGDGQFGAALRDAVSRAR